MTPEKVLEIVNIGRAEHAPAIRELIQPAFHIVATRLAGRPEGWRRADDDPPPAEEALAAFESALAGLPLGASRFGGVPDLPPGAAWPDREGVPMEFIAQIRLADLSDRRLPA